MVSVVLPSVYSAPGFDGDAFGSLETGGALLVMHAPAIALDGAEFRSFVVRRQASHPGRGMGMRVPNRKGCLHDGEVQVVRLARDDDRIVGEHRERW